MAAEGERRLPVDRGRGGYTAGAGRKLRACIQCNRQGIVPCEAALSGRTLIEHECDPLQALFVAAY